MQATYTNDMKVKGFGMLVVLFAPIYLFLISYNQRIVLNYLALGLMTALVVLSISKGIEMYYGNDTGVKSVSILSLLVCVGLCGYYLVTKDVAMVCSLLSLGSMPLVLAITAEK